MRALRGCALACLFAFALPTLAAEPVSITPWFAFHSDFDTNLNDALVIAGRERAANRAELFKGGNAKACFDGLAPSQRAGWNLAVDYYARIVSPAGWDDRQQFLLRIALAGLAENLDERASGYLELAEHMRGAAEPAYTACGWDQQDAANRAWVERLMPRIQQHGAAIAQRLEAVYGTPWHGLPLRVDVVAHAPPVGANTIWLNPEGGHILVSSGIEDALALEIMFHEASHTLVSYGRGDPLPLALEAAAQNTGVELPRDLWHVVMFYLTGEVMREVLGEAYTPYMVTQGLWDGRWGRYREAVEASMPAYLEGSATLQQAAASLLQKLHAEPGPD
ncbi:MAG: hypothetical protein HKN58_11450 [Xanthomonadales bacterium]|nr:hypothetical protein [Xanthomonadales bacterium]